MYVHHRLAYIALLRLTSRHEEEGAGQVSDAEGGEAFSAVIHRRTEALAYIGYLSAQPRVKDPRLLEAADAARENIPITVVDEATCHFFMTYPAEN